LTGVVGEIYHWGAELLSKSPLRLASKTGLSLRPSTVARQPT